MDAVTPHITDEALERYFLRRLQPAELLALDDHLATCTSCRERLRAMGPADRQITPLQASLLDSALKADEADDAHVPSRELAAYAAYRLDAVDRELTESHLETCSRCAAELRKITAAAAAGGPMPIWQRLFGAPAIRFGGAAIAVASLLIAVWITKRSNIETAEPFAQSPASPVPIPSSTPIITALSDSGPDCPDNSACVRITLDEQGKLSGLESLPAARQERVRLALANRKLEIPGAARDLRESGSATMGSGSGRSFGLDSPVGTITASDRPVFRWRAINGALGYKVTIADPAAGYEEIVSSPELQSTQWRVTKRLPRGRTYSWQVIALTSAGEVKAPSPAEGEARFRVLEKEKADEVAMAERTYAGRHLVLGVIYAEAGLLEDAERELTAFAAGNPTSQEAQQLLLAVRRRVE